MAPLRIIVLAVLLLLLAARAQAQFVSSKIFSYPGYAKGQNLDLVVANNKAYLAMGNGGLCIVDISSAAQPNILSRLDLPGASATLRLNGDLVFVAAWTNGLHIVNVADPRNPVLLRTIEAGQTVTDSALLGGSLFVAEGAAGIVFYNLSNPANPSRQSAIDTTGFAYEVIAYPTAVGTMIAVADGVSGLFGYNVTTSSVAFGDVARVRSVTIAAPVSERLLYYSIENGMWRAQAYPFSRQSMAEYAFGFGPHRVFVGNGMIIASPAMEPGTFAPPIAPVEVILGGRFVPTVNGLAAGATSDRVFIAESSLYDGYRLGVFDHTMQRVASTNTGGSGLAVEVQGNRIYVAEHGFGLHILETTPSGAIEHRSTYPSRRPAFAVFDNYMVVAAGGRSLHVVDISNAASPRLIADAGNLIAANGSIELVAVTMVGRQAFIEDDSFGNPRTFTIDLTDPSAPVYVGENRWPTGRFPTLIGENLFVAGASLSSYERTQNGTFSLLDTVAGASPYFALDMQIVGTTAFVCRGPDGVQIIDISNPRDLRLVTIFDTPDSAWGIHVAGTKAYIADSAGGVIVADVSNPAQPRELGRIATACLLARFATLPVESL